ncbi:MAG: hypothetical protein ABS949_14895 [Solibacillus sp.]
MATIKPSFETLAAEDVKPMIGITVEEYTHLKDIETRFTVLKNQMLHAEYCPIHTQVILGIEQEYAAQQKPELKLDMLPVKK